MYERIREVRSINNACKAVNVFSLEKTIQNFIFLNSPKNIKKRITAKKTSLYSVIFVTYMCVEKTFL